MLSLSLPCLLHSSRNLPATAYPLMVRDAGCPLTPFTPFAAHAEGPGKTGSQARASMIPQHRARMPPDRSRGLVDVFIAHLPSTCQAAQEARRLFVVSIDTQL